MTHMKTKIFAIISCYIFDAQETFPFKNDDVLGSYAKPYTPEFIVSVK